MIVTVHRRPSEEMQDFLKRLEAERMKRYAELKEKEADALEEVGERKGDEELKTAARSQRAAASEWLSAWREHPGSQDEE